MGPSVIFSNLDLPVSLKTETDSQKQRRTAWDVQPIKAKSSKRNNYTELPISQGGHACQISMQRKGDFHLHGDDVPRYTYDSCHWSLVNIFMENFSFLSCMGRVFDIKNDGVKPAHRQLNRTSSFPTLTTIAVISQLKHPWQI